MLKRSTEASAFPFSVFGSTPRKAATLSPLPHRFIENYGVLRVQPVGPLRAVDFDAIAPTIRSWNAPGRKLHGLVVQLREFPGWENVAGFVRHAQFLRNDHDCAWRVALVSDAHIPGVTQALADRLMRAQLRRFGRSQVGQAITWAAA